MTQDVAANLTVRLAETAEDVRAAQALRYRVFYENMGAAPSEEMARRKLDFDRFDDFCDHLLVVSQTAPEAPPEIVGTYRLLRRSRAVETSGFYSAAEFDLDPLKKFPGEVLELGRSCVDPAFRDRAVLQLLWKGISDYLMDNRITLMFGCASFPGLDLDQMAGALSYLHYYHSAPADWRPRALDERYVKMDRMPKEQVDMRQALREMPPLIKGYLRLGGVIGDGAVIDDVFNTVDVCLLVETENVPKRYAKHYQFEDKIASGILKTGPERTRA